MALRNSGLVAQRLFCGGLQQAEANSGKLVWNAALYSSRAVEAGAGEAAAGALPAAVPQYSAAAAAALAAKRANLVPGGSLKPVGMFNMTRGFASAMPRAAPAASVEPVATKDPRSALKKLAQAAAALVAALGLTAGTAQADSPEPWAIGFQDTATSTAQAMVDLHHDINFFVICILSLVFYMFFQIVTKFHYSKVLKPEKLTHHTTAEVIWTIVPTLIVVLIAIPSLTLIYSMDQHTDRPGLTVKIIGRQWYWSYEMHDHLQQKLLDPDRLVAIAEKSVLKA